MDSVPSLGQSYIYKDVQYSNEVPVAPVSRVSVGDDRHRCRVMKGENRMDSGIRQSL